MPVNYILKVPKVFINQRNTSYILIKMRGLESY